MPDGATAFVDGIDTAGTATGLRPDKLGRSHRATSDPGRVGADKRWRLSRSIRLITEPAKVTFDGEFRARRFAGHVSNLTEDL